MAVRKSIATRVAAGLLADVIEEILTDAPAAAPEYLAGSLLDLAADVRLTKDDRVVITWDATGLGDQFRKPY